MIRHAAFLLLLTSLALPSAADDTVTLEKIMAHPDWLGRAPESFYWADDGDSIYFERKVAGSEARELFEVDLDGEILRQVADAERGAIDADGGSYSRDFQRKVYARRGDIYLKDLARDEIRQLTRTSVEERRPYFTADGGSVVFERDGVWVIRELANGLEYQAAELRLESDPMEEDDELEHLAAQELRLFDYVRSQKEKRDAHEARERAEQQADLSRPPLPFYLGDEVEISSSSLSPDGKWLLVATRSAKRSKGERTPMPLWVTESGNVETRQVRPKVGLTEDVAEELLLFDLQQHSMHALDVAGLPGITDDPLAEIKAATAERAGAEEADEEPAGDEAEATRTDGKRRRKRDKRKQAPTADVTEPETEAQPRAVGLLGTRWSRNGAHLAVKLRSLDKKDQWIALVDFEERQLQPAHHLHDPAWINWRHNEFGWLHDDETLYYLSEEAGYSGLYTLRPGTDEEPTALVSGDFVVSDVQLARSGDSLLYRANVHHPGVYEIYRVDLESTLR